ncbi:MAG: DUF924 family protein, partial [Pseudomonadota bacterium]
MEKTILQISQSIRNFWLHESSPEDWFQKNEDFDQRIRSHFGEWVTKAQAGALQSWAQDERLCFAYILLCDQFPRNIFRN